jgi:hypothetical protein
MGKRILPVLLIAVIGLPAQAGERGFASKGADVLERPAADARPVARVAKQQPLEILGRDGRWAQVKAGSASGWVRLLDVRFNAPSKIAPATGVKPFADSGIRGFSEEDLLAGTPSRGELDKLGFYSVPPRDALGFARAAGLKARRQDYIEPGDYLSMDELPEDFFDE